MIHSVDPEKTDNWSQKSWEDLLLKMLSKSLDVVDLEDWTAGLGEKLGAHIPMYAQYPEEKVPNMYMCYGPGGRNIPNTYMCYGRFKS